MSCEAFLTGLMYRLPLTKGFCHEYKEEASLGQGNRFNELPFERGFTVDIFTRVFHKKGKSGMLVPKAYRS